MFLILPTFRNSFSFLSSCSCCLCSSSSICAITKSVFFPSISSIHLHQDIVKETMLKHLEVAKIHLPLLKTWQSATLHYLTLAFPRYIHWVAASDEKLQNPIYRKFQTREIWLYIVIANLLIILPGVRFQ